MAGKYQQVKVVNCFFSAGHYFRQINKKGRSEAALC
jgi:hypothetical protein